MHYKTGFLLPNATNCTWHLRVTHTCLLPRVLTLNGAATPASLTDLRIPICLRTWVYRQARLSSDWCDVAHSFSCFVSFLQLVLRLKYHQRFVGLIFVSPFLRFRFDEIAKKNNVEYHAGGSTQNSVKIAQVGFLLPVQYMHRYACNSRSVGLAALGIGSAAAQHVDTLQF